MQFSTVALLMAGIMATGLQASPTATPEDSSYYVLKSEEREGGAVVQYGETKRSVAARAGCGGFWQPACPKTCKVTPVSQPKCDDKNGGLNDSCDALVNDLYANQDHELMAGAKQLCWKNPGTGKTGCCIKWTKDVKGLTKGDLKERADKIKSSCDANGVSGKYLTVNFKGVCLSYCMSIGAGCMDESDFSS